jgi:hypothetical protein
LFCGDILTEVEDIQIECKILKIGLNNSKSSFLIMECDENQNRKLCRYFMGIPKVA